MSERTVFLCAVSCAQAAADADGIISRMPPLRRMRFDSASSPEMRLQLLAAQAAMDGALSAAVPGYVPPAEFTYLPDGRPYVRKGPRISISHTSGMAVCAASDVPVGADIEPAGRVFSPGMERKILLPGEEAPRGLLGAWVDKEAHVKLTGEGIANAMLRTKISGSMAYDDYGNFLSYIERPDIPGFLVSVCCREKFNIIMV